MEGRRWKEGRSREIDEEREGRMYSEDTHGDNEGVHNGGTPLYTQTHMLTMKGCAMEARMDFSLLTCSTCLS